jgi:hypothetical protein
MAEVLRGATIECYSGYKGEETPRAVILEGRRLEVRGILSRERALDAATGLTRDIWRCRLDDGRNVTIELSEAGIWRVSV